MPHRPVRIAPLTPKELTPEAREFFEATIGAEKAATFNMPRTFARHVPLIRALFDFNRSVQQNAEISPRLREIIIMRVAWLDRIDYVWGQHNQIMRGLKMGAEYIQAVKVGADDPLWSAEERSVLKVVDEMVDTRELSDGTWKGLAAHYSTTQILDILAVIGQYSMTGILFNAVGLQLEPQLKEFAREP
jgi:4-carboxymuconolactone decarboxylase